MSEINYRGLAQQFVQDYYGNPSTLKYYREEWWAWYQGCYHVQSDNNVTARMTTWMDEGDHNSKITAVRELRAKVMSLSNVMVDDGLEMPICIEIDHYDESCNWLAFQNKVVDLDVLVMPNARGVPINPTPRWFSPVVMSYRYDPGCKCPRFQELLDKLVPDKSIQDVLQEFFGYCLTRDTDMKAMLIMYGDTCTGKSTLSNVLEAMVGPANRSAVPLEGFWDRFAAQQTIGKLVNFCGDAKKIDTLAEGVIKRFTGGDTLLVDRKYKDPVSAKMTAKIVVATNVFPVVRDITDALWSRFIVVPMDVRLEEHEVDRTFLNSEKQNWPLRRELPGIFNWAIKGLKRLKQQGHFTVSQRLLQARAEVRHDNCSVALFVGERCKEGGTTTTKEFMHEYQCYCENQNLKRLSGVEVRKVIRMLMPDIRHRRLGARGQQQWYFDGVTVVVPRD